MEMIRRYCGLISVILTLAMAVCSCDDYDPYKNPRPVEQGKQYPHNEPTIRPGCSRSRPQTLPPRGDGGGGCTRRVDTIRREPRPRREPRHRENTQERDLVYPCPDHIFPFCTDENPYGVKYKSGRRGRAAWPREYDNGCLKVAPCPVWYYMQIDQPGDMLIFIEQKGLFKKLDVDFACWGPFEAESKREFLDKICSSYCDMDVAPQPSHRPDGGNHRNNTGGYPFGNLVDCSFDRESTEWCYIPDAKSGEWYLLLLTNYSQKRGTIHFERVDNMSTATTNCNVVIPININPEPKNLKQIDERTSAICLYEDKALVAIELEVEEGYSLPRNSWQQTETYVFSNGRTYRATRVGNHFECEIDITSDTTQYYATVTCPDPGFNLDTERHFIVRTTDCSPESLEYVESDPFYVGDESIADLVKGDKTLEVDFTDINGVINGMPEAQENNFNIDNYDVTVDYDELTIERVTLEKENGKLVLTPQMRGDWCECFMPDSLAFLVRMIPNNGDVHASPYEVPIVIGIKYKRAWMGRCLWALIVIGILSLFAFYLMLLLRKPRFKKYAEIKPTSYGEYGDEAPKSGQQLREKTFLAWFARWFLPGAEQNAIGFPNPKVDAITFVATRSGNTVVIPKKCINKSTMVVDGYDPEIDTDSSKSVKLGGNGTIFIKDVYGKKLGYLTFIPNDEHDGKGYRFLISILIFASLLTIIGLVVFIMHGIL